MHGDEALPDVFVAGSEILADLRRQQVLEQKKFIDDFQIEFGYAAGKYSDDVMTLAFKYIGHTSK